MFLDAYKHAATEKERAVGYRICSESASREEQEQGALMLSGNKMTGKEVSTLQQMS